MKNSSISSNHAFLLSVMSLLVAVLCLTVRVVSADLTSRLIMASIWAIMAITWLIQAAKARAAGDSTAKSQDITEGGA